MDWLSDAIDNRVPVQVGELAVCWDGDQAVIGNARDTQPGDELPPEPAAIRARIRFDDAGRYRPLPGARTLPRGWHVRCAASDVASVIDAVYPLVPRHVALAAAGSLRIATLEDVLARQGGRYEVARETSPEARRAAIEVLCGQCVKSPAWDGADPAATGVIPCPEPCSVMVALCRELALADPDEPIPEPDAATGFADFEQPANPVRVACLERLRSRS
ncbi:MAG: DR2241 family protein [Dehalococcoidia bacterium]|nr:DR2241 family protein [Dehalococcoidia bacterium]